jgi:hypothetical protein
MTDFAGLLRALARGGVDFIVVAEVAATAHGSARATYDVDVVYARSADNLARLAAAPNSRPCGRNSAEPSRSVWTHLDGFPYERFTVRPDETG